MATALLAIAVTPKVHGDKPPSASWLTVSVSLWRLHRLYWGL